MNAPLDVVKRARLRVAERITDLIGDTPIVRLRAFDKDTPGVELWAKCEFMNPGGSVKDRAAYQMIRDAMTQTGNDKRRAAKMLGLSHQGLLNKLKRYGLGQ